MKRLALAAALALATALPAHAEPHNVVIFVADGLRYGSVTPDIAPTMSRIRRDGVDFANSHSIYPTLTTANASAIATGHYLGDTGDYANVIFTGFPLNALQGSNVPFLENDAVLQEVKARFADGYMGPTSLLCGAKDAGFGAVVFGKTGPAAIQALNCAGKALILDDAFNRPLTPDGAPSGAFPVDAFTHDSIARVMGGDTVPFGPVPPNCPTGRSRPGWSRRWTRRCFRFWPASTSLLPCSSGRAIPTPPSMPRWTAWEAPCRASTAPPPVAPLPMRTRT